MRSYLGVIGSTGAPRLLAAALLGRLGATMLGVILALSVLDLRGSVLEAGLALTAHGACLALFAPLGGRLADRLRPRRVMLAYLGANVTAYGALLWLLGSGSASYAFLVVAGLTGATTPPSSAVVRAHWPRVVGPDRLPTAYALDTVTNSAMFVIGPPLAGVLAAVASPTAGLLVAAAGRLVGDLLLATTPNLGGSRGGSGAARAVGRLSGSVLRGRVRILLLIAALDTFCYGSLSVFAVAHGTPDAATTGVLMGVFAAGEVVGGTTYGARRWPGRARRHLLVLHLTTAAAAALMGAVELVVLIGVLFLVSGVGSGARDTVNQVLLADAAAEERRTETFAWLNTLMWGGYALGTAMAGLAHASAGHRAVAACAVAASVGAAVATVWLRRFESSRGDGQPGPAAIVSAHERR